MKSAASILAKGLPIRRILAVGDIHQTPILKQIDATIDRIAPDVTIFIGDYFDSFIHDHHDHVRRTAIWLKQGLLRHDRIFLLGNHDLPYAYPYLATCPGWTPEKHRVIRSVMEEPDWNKLRLSYSPNASWLFTHAGVSRGLIPSGITDVPAWFSEQETVALSSLKARENHWIFRGGTRRGDNTVGGPLWCDLKDFDPVPGLNQVFGHTAASKGQPLIREITSKNSINFCIDCLNTKSGSLLFLDDGSATEIPLECNSM